MHWAGALKESSSSPRRVASVRSVLALCGIALAVCGSACAASISLTPQLPQAPEPVSWTSYAGENQLQNSAWSRSLTRASVPRLAPVWTKRLDGRIYASPLAFTVGGQRLLFVSTEAGSVYALNARRREHRVAAQRRHRRRPRPAGRGESRPPVPSRAGGASCTSSGQQGCSMPSRSSPGTTRRAIRDS